MPLTVIREVVGLVVQAVSLKHAAQGGRGRWPPGHAQALRGQRRAHHIFGRGLRHCNTLTGHQLPQHYHISLIHIAIVAPTQAIHHYHY